MVERAESDVDWEMFPEGDAREWVKALLRDMRHKLGPPARLTRGA